MKITVVGSGIIGLTTAISLQKVGFQVAIITKELYNNTLSSIVGAIWFPYSVEPIQKANQWAATAFHHYEAEVGKAEGVSMLPFKVLSVPGQDNSWVDHLPKENITKSSEDLPLGYNEAITAMVPLIEPPLYLPYLVELFTQNGGTIKQLTITSLEELKALNNVVVNCTGLGAKEICNDEHLFAMRGQILQAEKLDHDPIVSQAVKGELSYLINRSQDSIIGGTDYDHDYNLNPEEADTNLIIDRIKKLGVTSEIKLKNILVGLRPKRYSIRCEQDEKQANIYHNYGHGGAGFTVAWGCAEHIATLINKSLDKH